MARSRSDGQHRQQQRARVTAAAALALLTIGGGCLQPRGGELASPPDALSLPVDLFSKDGSTSDADNQRCPATPATRTLTFTVTTVPLGGRFAPRNVGVIWIEDASGQFVRTLEKWGEMRAKWLATWQTASGGNTVDAVTGATLDHHVTHVARWDGKDAHGCDVPDGPYTLRAELTDRSGSGAVATVVVDTTAAPLSIAPEDSGPFTEMRLIVE